MRDFDYVEAADLQGACAALASHREDARIIAGGQAMVTLLRARLIDPRVVVSVRFLPEGRGIRREDGELVIGAMTTHHAVERDPLVRRYAPVLSEMEVGLASPQVRNAGTIGGNLCHADPAEDPAPVLIALNATAEIASVRGRRRVPLHQFYVEYFTTILEPDELLLSVRVPISQRNASGAAYLKHTVRNAVDFPVVGVAAWIQLDPGRTIVEDARIAFAAMADTPLACPPAAEALVGRPQEHSTTRAAAEAAMAYVQPVSDSFGSADYKRHVAGVLTERAIELAGRRAVQEA